MKELKKFNEKMAKKNIESRKKLFELVDKINIDEQAGYKKLVRNQRIQKSLIYISLLVIWMFPQIPYIIKVFVVALAVFRFYDLVKERKSGKPLVFDKEKIKKNFTYKA
jgi:hypothetical protein